MLRKSQPDFERHVKKIEAQAKKWFSYKKTCSSFGPVFDFASKCQDISAGFCR